MFKFFGKPNKSITSSVTGSPIFQFSPKGEFITDDKDLIKRAKLHFDYVEIKVESIGERVTVKEKPSAITIEVKEE
jgi:hypothetical protein